MTTPRLLLAALVLAPLALACAHAPAERSTTAAGGAPERILVTGSHVPQRVDPRTGQPLTASPVRVYTRDDLLRAGTPDLAATLLRLDPSIRP